MGVKLKHGRNVLPKVIEQCQSIKGKKVEVGVLGGENEWLAAIHEYGCSIAVTEKMRGYLASQGLHLKRSTVVIKIPERSFIRAGFDQHYPEVKVKLRKEITKIITGNVSGNTLADTLGLSLSSKIKLFATRLKSPPNSGYTIEKKGSSNPLVDSGDMIGSITYQVKG